MQTDVKSSHKQRRRQKFFKEGLYLALPVFPRRVVSSHEAHLAQRQRIKALKYVLKLRLKLLSHCSMTSWVVVGTLEAVAPALLTQIAQNITV
jgi:hypothetical protein